MTPQIAKLGHVALVTPDLDGSVWFFRDVLGLEQTDKRGDTVFLRAWGELEHHSLSLTAGAEAVVEHIGWRTTRPEDVGAFAAALGAQDVDVRHLEPDEELGQGDAIRFHLPAGGHPFELYYDIEKPTPPGDTRARLMSRLRSGAHRVSPRRLDHVNIWTDHVGKSERWLADTLGFRTHEVIRAGGGDLIATFMAVTSLSHDIAIFADLGGGRANRFHHLAYYLDNREDVLRGTDLLAEHGVAIEFGPVHHGIGQSLTVYARDPSSGHRVELCAGGFHVYEPDWEPLVWGEDDIAEGISIWKSANWIPGTGSPFEETTACQPLTELRPA
jgi:catechol 2,3-dioxygenase